MKKLFFAFAAALSLACFARPHGGPGPWRAPYHHHHHHHHGAFWTGVGVGVLGGALLPRPVYPAPAYVAAPAMVWVPPVYGERPVYRAGIFVGMERYVITPGYWR